MPMRDPCFRAVDCAAFDTEVTQRRPMKPPSVHLAERVVTPAQLDALKVARREQGIATHHDDDTHDVDNALSLVEAA